MVRLTEEMVVARTRISDLTAVKKLNCWGTELTDVSIIRDLRKVEVLSLSVNNIDTLADFQYCLSLQDLFVRKNNIKDLNEVCYLQNLPNLRNLWLDENPCADQDGYRLAVLRALPNLEKLDDKVVTTDELQNALAGGRILVHPLDMDASPTRSVTPSPEHVEYEIQRGGARLQHYPTQSRGGHITEYQDNDRRNANCLPAYQQNYSDRYEPLQNGQVLSTEKANHHQTEPRPVLDNYTPTTNSGALSFKEDEGVESDKWRRRRRHSSEDNPYSDNDGEAAMSSNQRCDRQVESSSSQRYQNLEYDRRLEEPDRRPDLDQQKKSSYNSSIDRDESSGRETGGWVRHSDKCRFHYHRRPVTRNSNILSAVLCLVKELDYPSLEVVEIAVRNRMDELEE